MSSPVNMWTTTFPPFSLSSTILLWHFILRAPRGKRRSSNTIARILHNVGAILGVGCEEDCTIRRSNTELELSRICALAKHDADGQVLALDQIHGRAAAAPADGHDEVRVGPGPARVGLGAEPHEDNVVDARRRKRVGARQHGKEVALVVEGEKVAVEGAAAVVYAELRPAWHADTADCGRYAPDPRDARLVYLWDETAKDVVSVFSGIAVVLGPEQALVVA
jgi:hypothetical protein